MGTEVLSDKEISSLLVNIKGKSSTLLSHTISPLGDHPIGFLGNHFLLKIKYHPEKDCTKIENVTFFIKTTPQVELHAQYVEDIGAFKKEVLLFEKLIPLLSNETTFLDRPWAPKCHIAKENFLLFEDLSHQNYTLAKLPELFDLEHCVAVVRTLADFHAASIIFENNNKTKIDELCPEAVKEVCYILEEGHSRNKWLKSVTDACVSLCERLGHSEESILLPNVIENAISNIGPSTKWCNVLSHGDLWGNNFMFNYDIYGKVIHCILIDYQLARYGPCALDLMCCLHLIAPRKLRDVQLDNLINVYYRRLTSILKQSGLDCNDILPFADLEEGCANYKQTALIEALFYGTIIWIPGKLAREVLSDPERCMELAIGSRTALVMRSFEEDEFFKNQMTDLIEELVDTMQTNRIS